MYHKRQNFWSNSDIASEERFRSVEVFEIGGDRKIYAIQNSTRYHDCTKVCNVIIKPAATLRDILYTA
jgi:hypothetical protein